MMNSRPNVRPYNPHVLVGNWFEDRVMEEEVLQDFLGKRNAGQLASQKMTEVERLSQSVSLSVPASDGLLRFGHQISLINSWTHAAAYTGEKSQLSCALAMGIPHVSSNHDGKTTKELTATGTTMIRPTLRSAWILRKANGVVDTEPIRYGDELMISDIQGELFLTCARSATRAGRTCDVILTNQPNRSSIWLLLHPSSHLRLEFDGNEVKANDPVLLVHAATNRCLSVNEEHSNRSPYGREYELLCELSTGSPATYKAPILWKFHTQSVY